MGFSHGFLKTNPWIIIVKIVKYGIVHFGRLWNTHPFSRVGKARRDCSFVILFLVVAFFFYQKLNSQQKWNYEIFYFILFSYSIICFILIFYDLFYFHISLFILFEFYSFINPQKNNRIFQNWKINLILQYKIECLNSISSSLKYNSFIRLSSYYLDISQF